MFLFTIKVKMSFLVFIFEYEYEISGLVFTEVSLSDLPHFVPLNVVFDVLLSFVNQVVDDYSNDSSYFEASSVEKSLLFQ